MPLIGPQKAPFLFVVSSLMGARLDVWGDLAASRHDTMFVFRGLGDVCRSRGVREARHQGLDPRCFEGRAVLFGCLGDARGFLSIGPLFRRDVLVGERRA